MRKRTGTVAASMHCKTPSNAQEDWDFESCSDNGLRGIANTQCARTFAASMHRKTPPGTPNAKEDWTFCSFNALQDAGEHPMRKKTGTLRVAASMDCKVLRTPNTQGECNFCSFNALQDAGEHAMRKRTGILKLHRQWIARCCDDLTYKRAGTLRVAASVHRKTPSTPNAQEDWSVCSFNAF